MSSCTLPSFFSLLVHAELQFFYPIHDLEAQSSTSYLDWPIGMKKSTLIQTMALLCGKNFEVQAANAFAYQMCHIGPYFEESALEVASFPSRLVNNGAAY